MGKGISPPEKAIETKAPRPLRADASRNRDKLAEIAGHVFAERGGNASLEEIARQAGVGIGTLYRHFPTREHLVEVVYRREVEGLCAAADELALHNAPDAALAEWMQRFVDYIAAKRGMANSLRILFDGNSQVFANTSGMVAGALRKLVDAAVADGSIRSDINSADLMQALSGIYSAPDTPEWREQSRRLVSLLMDGLRWGSKKARL
ncbi:DNA-binding transcriptional regulator, AcrR family [Phyllobacterium sp. CL33Tsu]|uniref:TetR/AcrR family transcriptional regulator n=1 Tax=Phyllobacterium sp. CL33Tsu TaxID=1798191 RepID=UPI0008E38EB1|nr:TetR/AcrR family transcriptional regulator [Phyllobacterium sp. CL33Tsu]SFI60583.1 DNA-binding transcriptional regulator, AcrR family [Phyllobacterium sp. CL33Tsu]